MKKINIPELAYNEPVPVCDRCEEKHGNRKATV